jgi:hypothetical protein
VTGLRLYWARNDGLSGHAFLSARELSELAREMSAQGITGWFDVDVLQPGTRVSPGQIDLALAKAAAEPRAIEDAKLWRDWLAFLGGAVENGGLVVR